MNDARYSGITPALQRDWLEAGDPVVCLNPRLTDAAPQRLRSAVVVMEK